MPIRRKRTNFCRNFDENSATRAAVVVRVGPGGRPAAPARGPEGRAAKAAGSFPFERRGRALPESTELENAFGNSRALRCERAEKGRPGCE